MDTLRNDERTDKQLVEAARAGDRDAFGELVRNHERRCVNLATSILRDRGEAEEETQNACWKAFEHLDQFKGEAGFGTWLLRIVENQCLMLLRRRRLARFVHLDDRDPEHGSEYIQLASPAADPEGELGNKEVIQMLKQEIRRMPPLLRDVLVMPDVSGLQMTDLAEQLSISVAAAKSRLLRARNELRQRMLKHCAQTGAWTLLSRTARPSERVVHQHMLG
jgi:RNA polymerase sigma-70 factor (ECF subfamily)